MNLALTRRADYTVRAALALARDFDLAGYTKIREVAERMGLPARYTPQILMLLARAGLAEARAGRDGGYRLARPPDEITLLEVVEAAEGPLRTERCTLSGGPCHWEDMCALHPAWDEATQALRDSLGAASLASVLGVDTGLERGKLKPAPNAHRARRKAAQGTNKD
jgi:Rrf2 family protein